MSLLQGKVAVITGGTKGVGRAIALSFAAEGARVVVAARTCGALERTVDEVLSRGGEAAAIRVDVTDEVSVSMLFDEIGRRYPRLDVLVNSVGFGGQRCVIAEMSTELLDKIIDINLRGTFNCCRVGFRLMQARGGGTIINISSLAGIRAWSGAGAYCAAKHAVIGLTRALAHEGRAHGIRASALCPGGVLPIEADRTEREELQGFDTAQRCGCSGNFLGCFEP